MVEPYLTIHVFELDPLQRRFFESELTERNFQSHPVASGRDRAHVEVLPTDHLLAPVGGYPSSRRPPHNLYLPRRRALVDPRVHHDVFADPQRLAKTDDPAVVRLATAVVVLRERLCAARRLRRVPMGDAVVA